MAKISPSRWALVVAACSLPLLWGCTHDVDEVFEEPIPLIAETLAIQRVATAKPEWERLRRRFGPALAHEVAQTEAFRYVYFPAPDEMPEDAVHLFVTLEDADPDSEFARLFALGFGRPTLRGRFVVADREGRTILEFDETYEPYDGSGFFDSHFDPLSMEAALKDFAAVAADRLARWSEGDALTSWPQPSDVGL